MRNKTRQGMAPTACIPSACLFTCLPACLPACLLDGLLAYLLACFLACLSACLPPFQCSFEESDTHTHAPTDTHTRSPLLGLLSEPKIHIAKLPYLMVGSCLLRGSKSKNFFPSWPGIELRFDNILTCAGYNGVIWIWWCLRPLTSVWKNINFLINEYFPQKYFRSSLAIFLHLWTREPQYSFHTEIEYEKFDYVLLEMENENNSDIYNPIQSAFSHKALT